MDDLNIRMELENGSVDPLVLRSGWCWQDTRKPIASGLESNTAPIPGAVDVGCGPSCSRPNSSFNRAFLPGEPPSWMWLWTELLVFLPSPFSSTALESSFIPFSFTDASSTRHLEMLLCLHVVPFAGRLTNVEKVRNDTAPHKDCINSYGGQQRENISLKGLKNNKQLDLDNSLLNYYSRLRVK